MFTGIVQLLGTVRTIEPRPPGLRISVDAGEVGQRQSVGDSVAVNGVCLTVTACEGGILWFDLAPETLAKTNLGGLKPGDQVNIEEALRVGAPLSGHFVQGHVDGVGRVLERISRQEFEHVWFEVPEKLTEEMVPKGSVAVDGVSLTLVNVERDRFSVELIPHTLAVTTLGFKGPGDPVNIETDILGKYVLRAVRAMLAAERHEEQPR